MRSNCNQAILENSSEKNSATSIKTQIKSVKEPRKLMDYFGERQEMLTSKLELKKVHFVQESGKDILLQKLRSVNNMMKHLIDIDTNASSNFSIEQNYKLLEMMQGTLKRKVDQINNTQSKKPNPKTDILSFSSHKLISRLKNKNKLAFSKSPQPFSSEYFPQQTPFNKPPSITGYTKYKQSKSVKGDSPSSGYRLSYSDNHLHKRPQN